MKTVPLFLLLLLVSALTGCRQARHEVDGRACYEQAMAALDADSVRVGEQLLHEAMQLAEAEGDLHTLYLARQRLAESLAWSNTEAALAQAKAALATYERHPDSERNHIILLDYIGTYASQLAFNTNGSYDEALAYTRQACALAEASRDTLGTELVCQTLTSLANIHWAMGSYDEALRCSRAAERWAPPHLLFGTQQVLARCLVSLDSLAEAEAVYRAMQPGDDLQAAYIVQSNLAKLALQRSDKREAEAAIDSAFESAEELYFKALGQKDDYYQATLFRERENERLRYSVALHRRMAFGAAVLVVMLAVVAVVVVRARLRVAGQRRLSEAWRRKHEVDERIHEARLHRQEAEAQREQLRQREGMVDFLQNFILQRSEVIRKLGESAQRHVALDEREWTEVERTLDTIDAERFARLRNRFPDLREEDVQLCILTRLRLTNRAIGNIFGISISAVQHRKLKLKKEVFGEDDPETSFEQVMDRMNRQ